MSEKKIALVTGASRGIGAAIADQLATSYRVIGTATSASGADSITERLGGDHFGVVAELDSSEGQRGLLATLSENKYQPAVLVNNAGALHLNLVMRMKDEQWQRSTELNLSAPFRLAQYCSRGMMRARWGRIVNLSSVVARSGTVGQANYVAAKAGVEGLTRALAVELGSRGITVNAVAPGFIDTDMTKDVEVFDGIPLNRAGTAEEIAHAVAFLCSEQASYITGQTLAVNGGMYLS